MIKNGVIINGVTYEYAPVKNKDVADCEQCDLFEKCNEMRGDILCGDLFGNYINKAFKRVEQ